MKILYDISVLGTASYHATARTGVSRVVLSVWQALSAQITEDSALSSFELCACWSPQQCAQAMRFLTQFKSNGDVELSPPANILTRSYVAALYSLYPEVGQQSTGRTVVDLLSRVLNRFVHNSAPRAVPNCDIYHSPFYPLPDDWPKISKVLTIYDLITHKYPQYFSKRQRAYMNDVYNSAHSADHIVVISDSTKADFCEYTDIPPERVTVTHLAASEFFQPCTDKQLIERVSSMYSIPEGSYLLSLCTLEPRKNIDQAIRAFVALVREQGIPDLNLVLVGTKGWDFDHIFAEIDGAGELRDRIVVTGFVPDEHLAPLYSGAMAFVYPSLYEGFGLPPLEAMQCGTPVITSNTSSLPEVVGVAGIMVDPQDTDALSQAMLDLYRNSQRRQQLSSAGIARAAQFSWSRCAAETVSAYRAAISR